MKLMCCTEIGLYSCVCDARVNGLFSMLLMMKGKHFVVSSSIAFKRSELRTLRLHVRYIFVLVMLLLFSAAFSRRFNEDKHG